MCAPLVWILRDGLGPDSQESGWGLGLIKFAVQWCIPALVLAVPLYGLWLLERRLAAGKEGEPPDSRPTAVNVRRISIGTLLVFIILAAAGLLVIMRP